MKLLFVTDLDPRVRSVGTVHGYVAAAKALGHEVAIFGEPRPKLPALPFTTDVRGFDLALFILQVTWDFPDMPHLARILDEIPRERRIVVDLWGRFNDTILIDHDFNHLEKLDGHLGWEWNEAISAVSDRILQPTLRPRRDGVRSFLFHAYDPGSVAQRVESSTEAAAAWRWPSPGKRPYGAMYVGSNWQRWTDVRRFLEQVGPMSGEIGPICLVGWDWDSRPAWAVERGMMGIDTDPALLADLGVETRGGVSFNEAIGLLGEARFAPVMHRPLFRELGFVTHRTFETFSADTLPVLMIPRDLVEAIYGPAALALVPGEDIAAHLRDAMAHPEPCWDAVLKTRAHLGQHHSFARRFQEIGALLEA